MRVPVYLGTASPSRCQAPPVCDSPHNRSEESETYHRCWSLDLHFLSNRQLAAGCRRTTRFSPVTARAPLLPRAARRRPEVRPLSSSDSAPIAAVFSDKPLVTAWHPPPPPFSSPPPSSRRAPELRARCCCRRCCCRRLFARVRLCVHMRSCCCRRCCWWWGEGSQVLTVAPRAPLQGVQQVTTVQQLPATHPAFRLTGVACARTCTQSNTHKVPQSVEAAGLWGHLRAFSSVAFQM